MRAIFLAQNKNWIPKVYGEETANRIRALASLDEAVYAKEELLAAPERFADVDYVFSTWTMSTLNEEEIRACLPSLKAVFYGAGTVQYFARPFLACGVRIFSAWAANAVPVAEYTVAQIILANKGFYRASRIASVDERKTARETAAHYPGNYGAKVGIIGAGMIGKDVIQMLKPFRLQVLVCSRSMTEETARELGVEKATMERVFAECDVVSNHLADKEQTKGVLNGALFASMKPYATFLNTGRGAQVVEDDLIRVLKERPDLTAVLDVTYPEPPVPESEFYRLPNCVLTPHIAGSSGDEVRRMGEYMCEEFERYAAGTPCRWEVTPAVLETMA